MRKSELGDILNELGIDDSGAISGGFVLLTKSGADTLVQIDTDGSAGLGGAITLATVTNATVAEGDLVLFVPIPT